MIWIISALTAICTCLFAYWGLYGFLKNRMLVSSRLEEVERMSSERGRNKKKRDRQRNVRDLSFVRVSQSFRDNVILSGLNIRPEEFVIFWFLMVTVPGILIFTFTTNILQTIAAVAVGSVLPPAYINLKVAARRKEFQVQLGDALMILANALRAGFSFEQALTNVADSLPDPLKSEFMMVSREMRMGGSVEEALNKVAGRMQNEDLKLLSTAVVVQQQVGGNLAEIIDTLASTIRDRLTIMRTVRTLTAQGRTSGMIIGLLPIAFMGLVSLFNPAYMAPMFESWIGHILLAVGAVMQITGFLVVRKMVDIRL